MASRFLLGKRRVCPNPEFSWLQIPPTESAWLMSNIFCLNFYPISGIFDFSSWGNLRGVRIWEPPIRVIPNKITFSNMGFQAPGWGSWSQKNAKQHVSHTFECVLWCFMTFHDISKFSIFWHFSTSDLGLRFGHPARPSTQIPINPLFKPKILRKPTNRFLLDKPTEFPP